MKLHEKYYNRHDTAKDLLRWLEANPQLPPIPHAVAEMVGELADQMVATCPDCPELYAGLRHLLEAKDCFVRASLDWDHT